MTHSAPEKLQQRVVCGQAHAILESLARSHSLPLSLCLSIEELLEGAWEIAYSSSCVGSDSNVIVVPHWMFNHNPLGHAAMAQR